MLSLAVCLILAAQRHQIPWPPETGNNGNDYYLRAAKLMDTPPWRDLWARRFREVKAGRTPLDLYRLEAKAGTTFLTLLERGNSMPVRDPFRVETMATLHPEYACMKEVAKVVSDAAYAEATDGRVDSATRWLTTGQKFAYRLPCPTLFQTLIQARFLDIVNSAAMSLLPKMSVHQLDQEIVLARSIASHPPAMARVAKTDATMFHNFVVNLIADPIAQGVPDQQPNMRGAMESLLELRGGLEKDELALLARVMRKHGGPSKDPDEYLSLLRNDESSADPKDRATYEKLITLLTPILKPKTRSLAVFAQTLTEAEKAHAVAIVGLYTGSDYHDLTSEFEEPENRWGLPYKPEPTRPDNSIFEADARKGSRLWEVDMYAIQMANVANELSSINTERTRRQFLLAREKSRLLVVHAEIARYRRVHGALPKTLGPLGNPADPTTGKPYEYRKLNSRNYSLAAVGVPGMDRIDMATKS